MIIEEFDASEVFQVTLCEGVEAKGSLHPNPLLTIDVDKDGLPIKLTAIGPEVPRIKNLIASSLLASVLAMMAVRP
jgi:hypothetical protein